MSLLPLIFPSLSRQPSMDTSKTTEDDTIRDSMEGGYVATRPRGTRARRTWPFNVRNLVAEDIRALDEFFMSPSYAARGGNSFLYPNLLPNWSFEFPATVSSDLVYGWAPYHDPELAFSISTTTLEDGTSAVKMATVSGQTIPAGIDALGYVLADQNIACNPGEVYQCNAGIDMVQGTLGSGALSAVIQAKFYAANGTYLSFLNGTAPVAAGWQQYGYSFTIPAGCAYFTIGLWISVYNSSGSTITLDGSSSITWDGVGCALLTPLTPYGRMVGSQSLGCLVRFSKMPEIADIGWANGVKVYGAKIELTEV